MAKGKDLTAQQAHAQHRGARLALLKNSKMIKVDAHGNYISTGRARDIIPKESIDFMRQIERSGNGINRKNLNIPK